MKKFLLLLTILFGVQQLNAQLAVTISYTNVTCNSVCNGTATAIPTGGTPPYAYSWNPVNFGNPITGLCAGNYTVTVTDALAAVASATVAILQPSALNISFITTTISCNGGTGNITASVSGGTAPYTYSWMPGNYTTPTISNVAAGTYTCTVTDQLGCTVSGVCVLTQPSPISPIISAPSSTCEGSNVVFIPNVTGGVAPYTYSWTFPGGTPSTSTAQNPTVVWNTAGTYTVTMDVWDASGCNATGNFVITIYGFPTVNITTIPAGCNFINGTLDATVTGGMPPYQFNWQPGNIVAMPYTNAAPNITYSLTTVDANGCMTSSTQFLGDSCDYVWPGDANDDAVANNVDILDIGIANGATGTTRANATLNWIGQPSTPWGQTLLSGTDYKWVDCNGDGTIDLNDTNAVIQNFGFIHNNRLGGIPVYDATLPDLIITMNQDSLAANSAGTLSVALGTSSIPATNVYGLAFTLNFDATQIDASTFRMNENGTWMGNPSSDLFGVVMNHGTGTGSVEVAITRYNQSNANGFGNIATVGFMTTSDLIASGNAQNVNFTTSNVTVISANETTQQVNTVNDSVVVADPTLLTGISTNENAQNISAYPNPFEEFVQINFLGNAKGKIYDVTLTDAAGRVVLTQQTGNASSIIIQRGTLESGIYFCSIRSQGETIGNTKLIVK